MLIIITELRQEHLKLLRYPANPGPSRILGRYMTLETIIPLSYEAVSRDRLTNPAIAGNRGVRPAQVHLGKGHDPTISFSSIKKDVYMQAIETIKYAVYRIPILRKAMAPKYKYKISPGQIAALINLIDDTRESGGVIVEIGVAQGDTSAFILEHMRTMGDARKVYFFDTFEGFTPESIDHEVNVRGKSASFFNAFRYGNEKIFHKNLSSAGYKNFNTHKGDAAKFDWSTLGPIGAVLLDVDLYKPTKEILNQLWRYIVEGGGIVVDDCLAGTPWDGSLQAYEEFITINQLPFRMVGNKGGLLVKDRLSERNGADKVV